MAKSRRRGDEHDEPREVTAEVGSEGGSYADPTIQEATRNDSLTGNVRPKPGQGPTGTVADAAPPEPQGIDDGVHTPE
jgi:hypothetical protein